MVEMKKDCSKCDGSGYETYHLKLKTVNEHNAIVDDEIESVEEAIDLAIEWLVNSKDTKITIQKNDEEYNLLEIKEKSVEFEEIWNNE